MSYHIKMKHGCSVDLTSDKNVGWLQLIFTIAQKCMVVVTSKNSDHFPHIYVVECLQSKLNFFFEFIDRIGLRKLY